MVYLHIVDGTRDDQVKKGLRQVSQYGKRDVLIIDEAIWVVEDSRD